MSSVLAAAFDEFRVSKKKFKWLKLKLIMGTSKIFSPFVSKSSASYVQMQKRQYEAAASVATIQNGKLIGDCVAAVDWEVQNNWKPYHEEIFSRIKNPADKIGLEFGCGPGRNLIFQGNNFKRLDGADLSETNLGNAKKLANLNLPPEKQPYLFLTSGRDVGSCPPGTYDFCFSVICLQHICVHEVRESIMTAVFKALMPNGQFLFQMGFKAKPGMPTVGYDKNFYQAGATNGASDVEVGDAENLVRDLKKIGFKSVRTRVVEVPDIISSVFETFIFVEAIKE